jgi:superoxide dismutase, Fe-Mn family
MFTLPSLKYSYSDLEPFIDAKTVEIHHSKHHQTYVTKLNESLANYSALLNSSLEDLLRNIKDLPSEIQLSVTNNGGQVYNHNLYFDSIGPNTGGVPSGNLAAQISQQWGSFEKFQEEFTNLGITQFGSGWAWLFVDSNGNLVAEKTANADSPIMRGKKPILTMDVWEHAYYLNYQNRRPEYIKAFWSIIDWKSVENRFDK